MNEIREFVYGVQYYRAPTPPPEEWAGDLAHIRSLGFDAIQLRVQWRWHERTEGGFFFDDLDELFDRAEAEGLRVVMKFMLETAPDWAIRRHDAERVDPWGRRIPAGAHAAYYVGGWWPCFENPGLRASATRFVRTVTERYRDRPGLLAWNVWNEPRSRPAGDCACVHHERRYRAWLRKRFGAVEALNAFYGKAWGGYEDVCAPTMTEDYAEMHLWRRFMAESIAERLAWIAAEVRRHDAVRPVFAHAGACSVLQDVLCDTTDDVLNAAVLDFYGSSFPVGALETGAPFAADMVNDWLRSVSPYYWMHEVYADHHNWARPPGAAEIRFRLFSCLSRGAKGLFLWQYKAERFGCESNGCGLVGIDRSASDRTREAAAVGTWLAEHGARLREMEPEPPQVALLYDIRTDLVARLEETTPENLWMNWTDPGRDRPVSARFQRCLHGAYRALWRCGLPVGFVSARDPDAFSRHRCLYLPYPVLIPPDLAARLAAFVEGGGLLVSEASPGLRAENTWVEPVVPGSGLDALFGVREKERRLDASEDELATDDGFSVRLPCVVPACEVRDAEVLGRWRSNGEAALTVRHHGRGAAVLLQSYLGLARSADAEAGAVALLRGLLAEFGGVSPQVSVEGGEGLVQARVLSDRSARLCFVMNYAADARNVNVRGVVAAEARDQVAGVALEREAGATRLCAPGHGVCAFYAEPGVPQ